MERKKRGREARSERGKNGKKREREKGRKPMALVESEGDQRTSKMRFFPRAVSLTLECRSVLASLFCPLIPARTHARHFSYAKE
jgi:hypothetical protein